jgi:hypothetical protein
VTYESQLFLRNLEVVWDEELFRRCIDSAPEIKEAPILMDMYEIFVIKNNRYRYTSEIQNQCDYNSCSTTSLR